MQPKDFELKMEERCNDVMCVLHSQLVGLFLRLESILEFFSLLLNIALLLRILSLLWKGINGNNARPEDTVANEVSQQYIQIQRKADSKKSRPKILIWKKITLFINDIIYFTAMQ